MVRPLTVTPEIPGSILGKTVGKNSGLEDETSFVSINMYRKKVSAATLLTYIIKLVNCHFHLVPMINNIVVAKYCSHGFV